MAEQRMKVRDKKVQKMTKDGLVEENLTEKSSVRVSSRASDVQMGKMERTISTLQISPLLKRIKEEKMSAPLYKIPEMHRLRHEQNSKQLRRAENRETRGWFAGNLKKLSERRKIPQQNLED